jgi:hypothetical protein
MVRALREGYRRATPLRLAPKLPKGWAGSSVVEHRTFNAVVDGSIPSRLTNTFNRLGYFFDSANLIVVA